MKGGPLDRARPQLRPREGRGRRGHPSSSSSLPSLTSRPCPPAPPPPFSPQAKEIMFHKSNLNFLMSLHTGQSIEKVEEDTDRDRYMSPLEAKNYGLIDVVIGGDEAGLKIVGSPKDFMKTKSAYIAWGDDGGKDDGSRGSRFGEPRIASTGGDVKVSPAPAAPPK